MNDNKVILLKIENLMLTKRMVIAQAERCLAKFGDWDCDYAGETFRIEVEIEKLHEQLQLQTR